MSLSLVGVGLGMVIAFLSDKYPEYFTAGLFRGSIIFLLAMMVSIYLHESIAIKEKGNKENSWLC